MPKTRKKSTKKSLEESAKPPKPVEDPKLIWAQEERRKKIEEESRLADDSPYADDRAVQEVEDKELKDAWNQLAAVARIKFPEKYAARFMLAPRKRLAAVATVLEWTPSQIASASGFSETSIRRWLKEPAVMEFIEAFQHFQGSKDGRSLLDQEVYPSILAMKEIRDDSRSPAAVRKDIAKFFLEMKFGKPKELVEQTGTDIKSLTEALREMKQSGMVEMELPEEDPQYKKSVN